MACAALKESGRKAAVVLKRALRVNVLARKKRKPYKWPARRNAKSRLCKRVWQQKGRKRLGTPAIGASSAAKTAKREVDDVFSHCKAVQ